MEHEGIAKKHDDENGSEFMKLATQDTSSRRQSIGQLWLMLWIAGAFLGATLIGQCVAMGEWPWSSLEAAQKWTGAPVCIAVMLKLEMDLGGSPLRLFLKLVAPVLAGIALGWECDSQHLVNWLSHLHG